MAARGWAGWAASCLPSRLRSPGGRRVPSADEVDAEEESRTPTSADNAKGHESFSDESPAQQTSQEAWPSHGDPEFLPSEAGTPEGGASAEQNKKAAKQPGRTAQRKSRAVPEARSPGNPLPTTLSAYWLMCQSW